MVSVNPNPAQGFYFFDPMTMGLPGLNSLPPPEMATSTNNTPPVAPPANTTLANTSLGGGGDGGSTLLFSDDLNKKVRKPYTITKSRESWTEQEHDKFLEALQLFDRDWKKIEAFVGSKTVIQIRSHAQKYFLKVQKSGASEHVPPPRPKRKAAHPYPQKAPKIAPVITQVTTPFQTPSASLEPAFIYRADSSSHLGNALTGGTLTSWSYNSTTPMPQMTKDDVQLAGPTVANNCCYSSSNESTPRTLQTSEVIDRAEEGKPMRAYREASFHLSAFAAFECAMSSSLYLPSRKGTYGPRCEDLMPDFAQVYNFIGSVFDPHSNGHLQRLKQMDPINLETILLLMRNLSVNLTNPKFEDHKRLLASYDIDNDKAKSGSTYSHIGADNTRTCISAPNETGSSPPSNAWGEG